MATTTRTTAKFALVAWLIREHGLSLQQLTELTARDFATEYLESLPPELEDDLLTYQQSYSSGIQATGLLIPGRTNGSSTQPSWRALDIGLRRYCKDNGIEYRELLSHVKPEEKADAKASFLAMLGMDAKDIKK